MFDKAKIINSVFGEVGFNNPLNPEYSIVSTANQESRTGRYFTDNDLVKIEFLKDNLDYDEATDPDFNTYLTRLQERSITSVMDRVFSESDFIDRQLLFQFANNPVDNDTLPTGFVGYKIEKSLDKHVAFQVTRCILEFDGTGDIDLYLFQTNRPTALFTQTVSITSTYQEVELNWRVDNTDVYEGDYYLGYFTDGLTVQPIKRNYENSNIKSHITNLHINNIKFPTATSPNLPDLKDEDGASETWGLNPDITVFNDYTDLIIQNKFIFGRAIQLQGQVYALQQLLGSSRSNLNQRFGNDIINKIYIEIEGMDNQKGFTRTGLKKELLAQISSIKKEIFRLLSGYIATGYTVQTMS